MTAFTDILDQVYVETKRPDLVEFTKQAVKAATLKLHGLDFWVRDSQEDAIQFDTAAYFYTFTPKDTFPLWRKEKFIRKYTDSTPGDFISILLPEQVLDGYGNQRTDIAYAAGNNIEMKLSTNDVDTFLVGYYVHPNITEDNYASWVATDYPFAVIYAAAENVFGRIGHIKQRDYYRGLLTEQVGNINTNEISVAGT